MGGGGIQPVGGTTNNQPQSPWTPIGSNQQNYWTGGTPLQQGGGQNYWTGGAPLQNQQGIGPAYNRMIGPPATIGGFQQGRPNQQSGWVKPYGWAQHQRNIGGWGTPGFRGM